MSNNKSNLLIIAAIMCALPVAAIAQESPKKKMAEVSLVPSPVLPSSEEASISSEGVYPSTPQKPSQQKGSAAPKAKRTFTLLQPEPVSQERKPVVGTVVGAPVTVVPEATTTVQLSSSDLNRIICTDGDIKEALTSDEKGLMIKITGKDAFVKFKVGKMSDGKLSYSTTPTEIYLVCGGATYSLVAFPSRSPSQTIKLSSGMENKIKENRSLYAGLPFEKRIMRAIKEVFTDNIPDSYLVTKMNQVDTSWNGMVITLRRVVDIEGEGMKVKEYQITLKNNHDPFKLTEKMFLRKEFALNPIAISIDKHTLRPGETSRLFVVEQRAESTMGNGFQLPTLEGNAISPSTDHKTTKSSPSSPPFGSLSKNNQKSPAAVAAGAR